ncbi:MAG: flagellar basal body L-ring protein FlgH [Bryobacterales bacterium]|nr:flagellar basal body L-ring protein FlgH [Bryobacterales bacterium]
MKHCHLGLESVKLPGVAFRTLLVMALGLLLANPMAVAQKKSKKDAEPEKTPLDHYLEEAMSRNASAPAFSSPGSIVLAAGPMADLARDLRAASVDDVVTILVVERASSVTSGTTATERTTKARAGFDGLFGPQPPTSFLGNVIGLQGSSSLDAEGATSRQVAVSTTMSARVTHVLPNGNLAIEGIKRVGINAEHQEVKVRGVIRAVDLGRANTVTSDRITQLEVTVNGKGVVADAIKKPNFLVSLFGKFLPL